MEPDSLEMDMETLVIPTAVPRFTCCKGGDAGCGVIGPGKLDRLLDDQRPVPQLRQSPDIELFGCMRTTPPAKWPADGEEWREGSGEWRREMDGIGVKLQTWLGLLEMVGTSSGGKKSLVGVTFNVEEAEAKVADCLAFLRETSYGLARAGRGGEMAEMVGELVRYMERLEDLPGHVTGQPAASGYLHTWLEVRWSLLATTYHLEGGGGTSHLPPLVRINAVWPGTAGWLDQLLLATILDLVTVAARRNHNKDNKRLLGCPCLEEMWICLYRISGSQSGADFWSAVSACCPDTEPNGADMALEEEELGDLVYRPAVHQPLLYWRLMTSLVSLISQPSAAAYSLPHKTLRQRLRPLFKKMETAFDEEHLRAVLQIVLSIADSSPPSLDLVSDIWKIFSKANILNSTFRLKTMTMDGAACLPKSPSLWLSQIQNLDTATTSPTSFVTFLKIVDTSLAHWTLDAPRYGPAVPWEVATLSGRFSISLRGSKARQLTEYGVYHLTSLYLVLAKADPATNGPKLLELLEQVLSRDPPPPLSIRLLVLKSRLALLLLLSESELPVAAAIKAVNEQLSAVVNSCVENQKDLTVRR